MTTGGKFLFTGAALQKLNHIKFSGEIMVALLSNGSFVRITANVVTLLFALFIILQILIGVGILPVSIVWGGRQTELTPVLQIASFVAVAVLALFIYIIRYRAGLVGTLPPPIWVRVTAWGVTGYMALNTLGNLASVSNVEKLLFSPITLALTVACLIVSLSNVN
ncbi:MAG: hypothetical protein D6768_19165 [Chloroflexi bacterium]|nr:MAG: hypothetical protein D6768_19165 [Chloroflexota bacterium]